MLMSESFNPEIALDIIQDSTYKLREEALIVDRHVISCLKCTILVFLYVAKTLFTYLSMLSRYEVYYYAIVRNPLHSLCIRPASARHQDMMWYLIIWARCRF